MAPVYAPNVMEAHFNFTYQDEPAQNTLYFLFATEPGDADVQDAAQALYAYWAAEGAPICPTVVTLNSVECLMIDGPDGIVFDYTPTVLATGLAELPAATNQDTLSVSFRTGLSGRSRRGRNYWVGLVELEINNNRVSSGTVSAIKAYYEGMIGDNAVVGGAKWGVYSRRSNNADRLVGLFTPVNSVVIVDDVVDSQRGRMP